MEYARRAGRGGGGGGLRCLCVTSESLAAKVLGAGEGDSVGAHRGVGSEVVDRCLRLVTSVGVGEGVRGGGRGDVRVTID